ncbi:dihydrofolate reductase family protein [Arthrobacter zhaoguopingii]|uniref:dihydrofolate reductase family protein n=1 Tax=Arthrobacter zhaoguopingii TaxID=2681491 RepID=UPI0013569D8E|nr:dihydrofolate reductase family protein [Arthrobacter zhaoguopingii]
MTKTIYRAASSLNGFLADGEGSMDWLFAVDQPEPYHQGHFLDGITVLVQGSKTYEWMLEAEGVLERPGRWREFYGNRPAFVFTNRDLPRPDGADVRFVCGEPGAVYPQLVEAAGDKDIWLMGGGDLAGQFFDANLLDEVQVAIAPVTLDAGAPLLPRFIQSDRLNLRSAEQLAQFAHLTYEVTRWQPNPS